MRESLKLKEEDRLRYSRRHIMMSFGVRKLKVRKETQKVPYRIGKNFHFSNNFGQTLVTIGRLKRIIGPIHS